MGQTAGVREVAATAELARLLADASAGLDGAEARLVERLHLDFALMLRQRLSEGEPMTMAGAGALVQRHWEDLLRGQATGGKGRQASRRSKAEKSARDGDGSGGAGDPPARIASPAEAQAASLRARYVEHAADAMRLALAEVLAHAETADPSERSGPLPATRALQVLDALRSLEPPLGRIAHLGWFGGIDAETMSRLFDEPEAQVQRHWNKAGAFLTVALKGVGLGRRAGQRQLTAVAQLPDAHAWERVSALFEIGIDMPKEQRAAWLKAARREEPGRIGNLLRDMLAAADAPNARDSLDRGPPLPQWQEEPPQAAANTGEADDTSPQAPGPERRRSSRRAAEAMLAAQLKPRLAAPALATGMRLGPWLLLGPMNSSDARVSQWRARRVDDDPASPETALLVPHQWRSRSDLAEWLAYAAARPISLRHPHIARLVEVGVSDEGTPWIAAELAEGQSIDRWCRDNPMGMAERRKLSEQALSAVKLAHARLVLHGRMHPSQIVVTPSGLLRWLNFGLHEVLVLLDVPAAPEMPAAGPPPSAYAAPEQAIDGLKGPAEPHGAAFDIYAFGLILFEVLSGASPWQPQAPGMELPVAEGSHWPRPSMAAERWRLRRALRGELDAIVVKATQTEAARRYASAAEMLDDLERASAHRPVAAMKGGLIYELRCLSRGHRALTLGVVALAATLVAFSAGLAWKALGWVQERDQTEAAWSSSESVTALLQGLLQDGARAGGNRAWPDQLAHAESVARSSLKEEPAGLALALALLGRQQADRGAFAEGRNLLAEALPQLADPAQTQEAGCDEAWAQARQDDDPEEAEKRLRRIAENRSVRPVTRALCLARLADLERRSGRPRDAYLTAHEARAQWEKSARKPAQLALLLGRPMAQQSAALGRFHEAQRWLEWNLAQLQALQQDKGAVAVELREQLGEIVLAAGDARRAVELADANLIALTGTAFAPEVDVTKAPAARLYNAAAEPRLELHQLVEARTRLERAISLADARDDPAARQRARCLMALAAMRDGDLAGAERWLKTASADAALDAARTGSGPSAASGAEPGAGGGVDGVAPGRAADHQCRAATIELAFHQGRYTEAQREADRLLAIGDELAPRLRAAMALVRAEATLAARAHERALAAALQALQQARALHQSDIESERAPPSFRSGQAALVLAEAHRAVGDMDAATQTLDYALQQLATTLPESHPWRRRAEATKAALATPASKKP